MTTTLYGITNCDSVKKARAKLKEAGADYQFCDFKKTPPDAAQIGRWLQQIELAQLLNKRGTTWRKLSVAEQAQAASEGGAIAPPPCRHQCRRGGGHRRSAESRETTWADLLQEGDG